VRDQRKRPKQVGTAEGIYEKKNTRDEKGDHVEVGSAEKALMTWWRTAHNPAMSKVYAPYQFTSGGPRSKRGGGCPNQSREQS